MTAADTIADEMAKTYAEFEELKRIHADTQQRFATTKARLSKLHDALTDARAKEIQVTDHALLRYAERVLGFDVEAARAQIVASVAPLVFVLGDGRFPIRSGAASVGVAVVEKGVVKTVLPA